MRLKLINDWRSSNFIFVFISLCYLGNAYNQILLKDELQKWGGITFTILGLGVEVTWRVR